MDSSPAGTSSDPAPRRLIEPPAANRVTVRIARAFNGPRHKRLEAIWDTIAEYARDRMVLRWEPNLGPALGHAEIFNKMWRADRGKPNRYLLLTESDFLPDLASHWLPTAELTYFAAAAFGVPYVTRNPLTLGLREHGPLVGGWWLLFDKVYSPDSIDFHGRPDPCNQLAEQVKFRFVRATCCAMPRHFGTRYPGLGEHLFWSRHYHDDPDRTVAGVNLGDMQRRVDAAITAWIWRQPKRFVDLLRKRAPRAFRA